MPLCSSSRGHHPMVAGGCAKLVPTSSSGAWWWWWPSAQLGDHGQGVTKKCKRCFAGSPHLSDGNGQRREVCAGNLFQSPLCRSGQGWEVTLPHLYTEGAGRTSLFLSKTFSHPGHNSAARGRAVTTMPALFLGSKREN